MAATEHRTKRKTTPVLDDTQPRLALLELSDSFRAIWPSLCEDLGYTLVRTRAHAAWGGDESDTIRVVSAGGMEEEAARLLAEHAETRRPSIVVVGANTNHRTVISLLTAGIANYFALPEDLELLRAWLVRQGEAKHERAAQGRFVSSQEERYRFEGMLGSSEALQAAHDLAARVIPRADVTVLITGETGTGKELLARAIHYNGPRRDAPFVDLNCASIPEQLLESELFGHEKGAFTDASSAKPGLFEVADGGTIFLDEIGHLPQILQGKLLRFMEQRTFRRLGGTTVKRVDVRVLAATHVHLADAVKAGRFREDLYYRLNILPIELPPLRMRDGDVLLLANHFLDHFATEYSVPRPRLSAEAGRGLKEYPWPGNVRELRNLMERTILLQNGLDIRAKDLSFRSVTLPSPSNSLPFPATMDAITQRAAVAMVDLCHGNRSAAARRLGISRTRLLRLCDSATTLNDVHQETQ